MSNKGSAINWIQLYIVPGLIFQSVIVGGGYGTGREIAEFFLINGPLGAVLGMIVSCLIWGAVLAVAFEFARITKSYNYRSFFKALLGRYWIAFEIIYLLIGLLVLAVLGSAAGEIVAQLFDIPSVYGAIVLMTFIGLLTYFGSKVIERVFVGWSVLLYVTYFLLLMSTFNMFGTQIIDTLKTAEIKGNWALDGVRYAAYNLNGLAAVLFVVPRFTQTKHAVGAGLWAGLLAILPGILVLFVLLSAYPGVNQAAVPVVSVLASLQLVWLLVLFQSMLFGTFIETGAGIIHAVNERIADSYSAQGKKLPDIMRAIIAVGALIVAIFLADVFGIISLIAKGYGSLSYAYIAVVIIPLMTLGLWRVIQAYRDNTPVKS